MKNIIKGLIVYFSILCCGCNLTIGERGNGNIVTERYDIGDFTSIEVDGGFNIRLEQHEVPHVQVSIDENLFDYIDIEKVNNDVNISSEKTLITDEGVNVVVFYNTIESVDIRGAARLTSEGVLKADDFSVNMSGAGVVDLEVDLKMLEVIISGAGAVKLYGRTQVQEIDMSGAGGLEADDLISDECIIQISGVGGASINVLRKLDASVSGIGSITYKGDPIEVNTNVSGVGQITKSRGGDDGDSDV